MLNKTSKKNKIVNKLSLIFIILLMNVIKIKQQLNEMKGIVTLREFSCIDFFSQLLQLIFLL